MRPDLARRIGFVCVLGGVILILLLMLGGCAGAKVSDEQEQQASLDVRRVPSVIYVQNFDLASSQPSPSAESKHAAEVQRLTDTLAQSLVDELNRKGLHAQRLSPGAALPSEGWVVTGRLVELKQGSDLARSRIGFGVGASDAQMHVMVGQLKGGDQEFLQFDVDSGSGHTPGSVMPLGTAVKLLVNNGAAEKDMQRAASVIADHIAKAAYGPGKSAG